MAKIGEGGLLNANPGNRFFLFSGFLGLGSFGGYNSCKNLMMSDKSSGTGVFCRMGFTNSTLKSSDANYLNV